MASLDSIHADHLLRLKLGLKEGHVAAMANPPDAVHFRMPGVPELDASRLVILGMAGHNIEDRQAIYRDDGLQPNI